MRNYAPTDAGPTRPASVPVPSSWQQSASEPLLWRSPAEAGSPAPAAPTPAPQPAPVYAAPAAPPPAPEPEAAPSGGIGDEANDSSLLKILAAHESRRGGTPSVARKLADASRSSAPETPPADSGEAQPQPEGGSRRSRSRAAFDYMKTDALRADMTPSEIQNIQRVAAPKPETPTEDISEASYTEIDHSDVQRTADTNDADVDTASDGPTDMLFAASADSDADGITPTVAPGVQHQIDPNVQRMLDEAMTVNPSSSQTFTTGQPSEPPTAPDVPRAAPSVQRQTTTGETSRPTSTPIQREADPSAPLRDLGDNISFTPAPRETSLTPSAPNISRAADTAPNVADGTSVPSPTSEVQRLLDQAMTVNPSSSAPTPVQRTPDAPLEITPDTPIQRTDAFATTWPSAQTPIQRTPETSATPDAPIQRTAQPDSEVQRLLDQAMTVNPSSSASTPVQRTSAEPLEITPDTPIQRTAQPASTPGTPIQRTAQPATTPDTPIQRTAQPDAPIQREADSEVQRLLNQAESVTPSSAVNASQTDVPTPATDRATPASVQRTPDSPSRPNQTQADTPVQRTPDSPSRPNQTQAAASDTPISDPFESVTSTPAPETPAPLQSTSETAAPNTPIQRQPDAEVQRLLDQAMTVNPSSAAPTQTDTPAASTAPTVQRTPDTTARPNSTQTSTLTQPTANMFAAPVQRTASSSPETPIQRTEASNAPISGPFESVTAAPAPDTAPIQREIDPEVQRLLDQALTVNPSSSAAAPDAPATATPSVQRSSTAPTQSTTSSARPASNTPAVQRSSEARPNAASAQAQTAPARAEAPQSGPIDSMSFTPPAAFTPDAPIQREIDPNVQRLLDQALTVNPSSSAAAQPTPEAPTSPTNTPIQRTAAANPSAPRSSQPPSNPTQPPAVQRTSESAVQTTAAPIQRGYDPEVQRLLDQALTINPSSSAPADVPAASSSTTPSVQRSSNTPAQTSTPSSARPAANTPSVQRSSDTRPNAASSQAQSRAEAPQSGPIDSMSFTPPAAFTPNAPIQRALDPEVQRLLDQAMTVNPSSSAPTPDAPAAASAAAPSVQRTPTRPETPRSTPAKPVQRSASDAKPIQRTPASSGLDPEVQRLLDQAMTVNPSSSAPASDASAASATPIQRQAASVPPTSPAPGVSPSIQSDPFNRTLDPAIQRRLAEAMRVTPSSSANPSVQRTPEVTSRRPFIPSSPASETPATPSTPSAPMTADTSAKLRRAEAPSTPRTSDAASANAAASNAAPQAQSSGNLESDLLRWMGMSTDTPIEGRLSRSQNDTVSAMMRKAETSTARPTPPPTPVEPTPEPTSMNPAANNGVPSFGDMPSISRSVNGESESQVQRAITIDEVSSSVGGGQPTAEGAESSIDDVAHRVLDLLRNKLRLERERNRKF